MNWLKQAGLGDRLGSVYFQAHPDVVYFRMIMVMVFTGLYSAESGTSLNILGWGLSL